jgi:hypothetical protein
MRRRQGDLEAAAEGFCFGRELDLELARRRQGAVAAEGGGG